MEDLSRAQAAEVKQTFREQDLPDGLRQVMNGIGLCKLSNDPEAFGVVINLTEDYDHEAILANFPERLRDNVCIKTAGVARPR